MDCVFKELSSEDSEGLFPLLARSMSEPWTQLQLAEALALTSARGKWAFSDTDDSIGFVLGRRIADLLEIDLVGVDPGHRRKGIAAELLRVLLVEEGATGMIEARLELDATNAPARALYEQLGFVVVGERARYYPDGGDALLLSRRTP